MDALLRSQEVSPAVSSNNENCPAYVLAHVTQPGRIVEYWYCTEYFELICQIVYAKCIASRNSPFKVVALTYIEIVGLVIL